MEKDLVRNLCNALEDCLGELEAKGGIGLTGDVYKRLLDDSRKHFRLQENSEVISKEIEVEFSYPEHLKGKIIKVFSNHEGTISIDEVIEFEYEAEKFDPKDKGMLAFGRGYSLSIRDYVEDGAEVFATHLKKDIRKMNNF